MHPLLTSPTSSTLDPLDKLEQFLELGRFQAGWQWLEDNLSAGQINQQTYHQWLCRLLNTAAEFFEEIGDENHAIFYWEHLLNHQPDNGSAWHGLGLAYANQGNLAKAVHMLSNALKYEPTNAKVRQQLHEIQSLMQQKNHE